MTKTTRTNQITEAYIYARVSSAQQADEGFSIPEFAKPNDLFTPWNLEG
jgi:hypothetical protein